VLQHKKHSFLKTAKQNILFGFNTSRLGRRCRHFIHQNWVTVTIILLSIGLCLLILYMLLAPLPELPVPIFGDERSITSSAAQAKSITSLDSYTRLLKTRDLFKPSIPIPAEKKIGKTTAQQLAERLQFLGTSGDEQNLSALVFIPERGPGSFQIGDRVAEFVLKDIRKDRLVLEFENEKIILKR
jgi:hypothetical protein